MESSIRVTAVPSRVGNRKNRPMDMPTPSTTARVVKKAAALSLPSLFSSQASNLEGSSSSSPSAANWAENMRAVTPLYMESQKLTTPRIRGQPRTGCLSLMNFSSFSWISSSPSGFRTTTACFFGPRIMIPSIRAWPPHMVLKPFPVRQPESFCLVCMDLLSLLIGLRPKEAVSLTGRPQAGRGPHMTSYGYCIKICRVWQGKNRTYVSIGSVMVTTQPPPSAFPISRLPSCRVTISSHTARPIPEPRALELPL